MAAGRKISKKERMKSLAKIIIAIIVNAAALLASAYLIPGFLLNGDIKTIGLGALILTALNYILKPILKLILGPVIIFTLGVGLLIVNVIILKILDLLSPGLTIFTIPALIYASLLIGLMNLIFHKATK